MRPLRIVVLGGGFAGLWSAVGAVRKLEELGQGPEAAVVTLVNRDGLHNIRVRNYEADLSTVRVPLEDVLDPIGVGCKGWDRHVVATGETAKRTNLTLVEPDSQASLIRVAGRSVPGRLQLLFSNPASS